jgi:ABC-type transport system involved in multi-copper enzyme maturation permease subunit
MILNLAYSFLYNKNNKDIFLMLINNIKIYLTAIGFYSILYFLTEYLHNRTLKKVLYIVFLIDLISLILNILTTVLPDEYSIIKNVKNKLSLYKE